MGSNRKHQPPTAEEVDTRAIWQDAARNKLWPTATGAGRAKNKNARSCTGNQTLVYGVAKNRTRVAYNTSGGSTIAARPARTHLEIRLYDDLDGRVVFLPPVLMGPQEKKARERENGGSCGA